MDPSAIWTYTLGLWVYFLGKKRCESLTIWLKPKGIIEWIWFMFHVFSREASYGHYLTQAQLTERIGISTSASEMAAKSLKKAMKVLGATANTSEAVPQIVSHRDAVLMTLHDFRMTYQLGQALTENLAHIWPKNVHMLVTPPMPDGFCNSLGEKECKRTTPCKWKVSKYSPESFASKNHSHKPRKSTCSGNFAGWICWREVLTGLRSEAQWHCFEPANFKGVEPSNSSQEERFLAPKLNVWFLVRTYRPSKRLMILGPDLFLVVKTPLRSCSPRKFRCIGYDLLKKNNGNGNIPLSNKLDEKSSLKSSQAVVLPEFGHFLPPRLQTSRAIWGSAFGSQKHLPIKHLTHLRRYSPGCFWGNKTRWWLKWFKLTNIFQMGWNHQLENVSWNPLWDWFWLRQGGQPLV